MSTRVSLWGGPKNALVVTVQDPDTESLFCVPKDWSTKVVQLDRYDRVWDERFQGMPVFRYYEGEAA